MTSKVFVSLRVKAAPDRAFAAFVEEIGAWWKPNGLFQTTPRAPGVLAFEPGQGGALTETLANGKVFEIGRITAWEPPARLEFTWRQANFPLELHTEVEVRFEAIGDETRVSVEHRGFDQVPEGAARHGFPDEALLMRLAEWWRSLLGSYRDSSA
ncbi:SRPBCC family protein [Phenylobacterium sp.]|uniref:SRPBCC family protein n=1 Tax=Phenylobacterium sp. TaxID=1871053 RepID=UPI00286C6242|nr:SRPBCC family protein [Phenylobacterium sp.]